VNPNLIYLQTTAMTEPLYLALFIWAMVYFSEFAQVTGTAGDQKQSSSTLLKCGFCLTAAGLTRYDGWFLSAAICGAVLTITLKATNDRSMPRPRFRNFLLLGAAAPVFWLAYNAVVYRNPLEFANGPYSARAIERKTSRPDVPPRPGLHNLPVAGTYFLKSAELNLAEGNWPKLWIVVALAGVALCLAFERRSWALLLLWIPLLFYALSIAYGGVPIFLPVWWPFSFYNARYGLELLPAFAVFVALAGFFLAKLAENMTGKLAVAAVMAILVIGSYSSIWRTQSVCFREAWVNSRTRLALESELAARLKELPPDSTLLMYLGDHVGALQQAGIPLRRVIHEGNHRTWKQPADPQGLWERALANPAQYADFVVAVDGDPVATAMQGQSLSAVAQVVVPGKPRATVYRTHRLVPVITSVTFTASEALRD
jgi:hypothetical protein